MATRKQFTFDPDDRFTTVTDHVGKFIPEMSLPIDQILAQFAYVDNIRLIDLMKQGYDGNDSDESFDVPDFDAMDIAEKQEYYEQSKRFIQQYEESLKAAKNAEVPTSQE